LGARGRLALLASSRGFARRHPPAPRSPSSSSPLANPAVVQEEREKVKDIVGGGVDRSTPRRSATAAHDRARAAELSAGSAA
jgi:hypothetical protein